MIESLMTLVLGVREFGAVCKLGFDVEIFGG
jgi:hypothetical protein